MILKYYMKLISKLKIYLYNLLKNNFYKEKYFKITKNKN